MYLYTHANSLNGKFEVLSMINAHLHVIRSNFDPVNSLPSNRIDVIILIDGIMQRS